ncbi:MAG: AbrB/MazE/SpoVT family DNA-binding domain-containing protein [Lachnospiraceae bacterium]|nr:AbrB/MazE/SpoVT family DNA-binding domain-containing protein [Lachnospiraceae bacterium]
MKTATVSKWGNAQGIRIPEAFCSQLGLSVGDKVALNIEKDRLIIVKADECYSLQARYKAWDKRGQSEPEYDWGEPVGKEIW